MRTIKTAALCGLGGIGGYISSFLGPYLGDNFRVVAGGARYDKIKTNGLTVNGKKISFNVVSPDEQTGPADLVIVITKFTALRDGLEAVKNQVGPDTIIMCPLNGVDAEDVAAEYYNKENIIPSFARVSVMHQGSIISFRPEQGFIRFGWKDDEKSLAVDELCTAAGLPHSIPRDITQAMWHKFISNVSENQVCAACGFNFGELTLIPEADRLRVMVCEEAIKLAHAKGIDLDIEIFKEKQRQSLLLAPPGNKPSTLQDIEAGRKTEVEMFAGSVIRMGKEYGIETPLNEFLYNAIIAQEKKHGVTE